MQVQVNHQSMEELFKVIPKQPQIWNSEDVSKWLKLIGLDMYQESFQEMRVDGLLILDLEEQDIEEELNIKVKLHWRKIVKALDILKSYDEFLWLKKEPGQVVSTQQQSQNASLQKNINHQKIQRPQQNQNAVQSATENRPNQLQEIKMIIRTIEAPAEIDYEVTTQGLTMGRNNNHRIVLSDESSSWNHARILFQENKFYLQDMGSMLGTFIKIQQPYEIKLNDIFEVGSYQLMVTAINIDSSDSIEEKIQNSFVHFEIYDGPEDLQSNAFDLRSGDSIGRKNTNMVQFTDDLHMSNLHCKVNLINKKFFFEDIASTNGSWLWMSLESNESVLFPLKDKVIFKVGSSAMYEVVSIQGLIGEQEIFSPSDDNPNQIIPTEHNNLCCICWNAERDSVLQPCRHNVSCAKCVKSLKNCPICRTPIHDIIMIYKA